MGDYCTKEVNHFKHVFLFADTNYSVLTTTHREERGYFPLANCIVESEDAFSLDILSPTQTMNLRCKEMQQRNRWKRAIEYEITRVNEVKDNVIRDRTGFDLVGKLEIIIREEARRMKDEKLLATPSTKPLTYPEKKTFFILSIDGGGLRGVITTLILSRLLGHFPDLIVYNQFFFFFF